MMLASNEQSTQIEMSGRWAQDTSAPYTMSKYTHTHTHDRVNYIHDNLVASIRLLA